MWRTVLMPVSQLTMSNHHLLRGKEAKDQQQQQRTIKTAPKTTIWITIKTSFSSQGNTWLKEALLRLLSRSSSSRRILEKLTISQLCSSNISLSRGVLLQAQLKSYRWKTWRCTNALLKPNESVQIVAVITSLSQVSNRRRIMVLTTNSRNRWAWSLM